MTSNPAGIDCGATCFDKFNSGTSVTLTAIPSFGSTFAGWGGDCSSLWHKHKCTIIMNANKTCTATFNTSDGGTGGGTGGGGGSVCSLSYGVHPLNAIGWLLIPMFVLARRIRRG